MTLSSLKESSEPLNESSSSAASGGEGAPMVLAENATKRPEGGPGVEDIEEAGGGGMESSVSRGEGGGGTSSNPAGFSHCDAPVILFS